MASVKAKGEVRELVDLRPFIPRGAVAQVVAGHRDFISRRADAVRKTLKAFILSCDYVLKNREWAMKELKSQFGYSQQFAELTVPKLNYPAKVTMDRKVIEEALSFLIASKRLAKTKPPAADTIYTKEFLE